MNIVNVTFMHIIPKIYASDFNFRYTSVFTSISLIRYHIGNERNNLQPFIRWGWSSWSSDQKQQQQNSYYVEVYSRLSEMIIFLYGKQHVQFLILYAIEHSVFFSVESQDVILLWPLYCLLLDLRLLITSLVSPNFCFMKKWINTNHFIEMPPLQNIEIKEKTKITTLLEQLQNQISKSLKEAKSTLLTYKYITAQSLCMVQALQ